MTGLAAVSANSVMMMTLKIIIPPIVPLIEMSPRREPTILPTFMPMPKSASTTGTMAVPRPATCVVVVAT